MKTIRHFGAGGPLGMFAILAALGLLAFLAGCGLHSRTATVSYFHSQDPPPPEVARHTGEYGLYAFNSPNPLYTARIREGEEYGFRRSAGGKIVGFAPVKGKIEEIPLENWATTSYEWYYSKE
jgi:hypothetical protein